MRIISGKNRGTKLYTLEGENTRPTLDRVKEAVFSKIQFQLQDAVVLDLFAGSGALSLEALSRGAKKAYLCDNSGAAINVIKKNVQKTNNIDNTVIINKDYQKALLEIKNEKFDIVFLDAPYKSNYDVNAVKQIISQDLLNDNGIILIETDDKLRIYSELENVSIHIYDEKKYGRVYIIFLSKM